LIDGGQGGSVEQCLVDLLVELVLGFKFVEKADGGRNQVGELIIVAVG